METQEKVISNDKLTRRKIEIRPNPSAKERQKFPTFPNFPQIELNNSTKEEQNKTEMLPQAQPFVMSKSESRLRASQNKARRKIDSIPINLTPSDPYRKAPYYDDYYEDDYYYYDDYYDDIQQYKPKPQPQPPTFKPLPTKPPKKVNYQTRKSPPKSTR